MKIKYPDCPPPISTDCQFTHIGCSKTLMHSPLVFDRNGNAVGGGGNTVTEMVVCNTCNRAWSCKRTELAIAQGADPEWKAL